MFGDEDFILIIDAGHGGEDGGASAASGAKESQINLEIALRTEALAALIGIPTRMIRSEDVSIHSEGCETIAQKKVSDLKNRVKLVQTTPNAILLSIHQNHFSMPKYYGTQVFYNGNESAKTMAALMQADFQSFVDFKNKRKSKVAESVYLMQNVNCPAVLVECGFLSNSREAELLQNDEYQKKLAAVMLRTIALNGRNVSSGEI